MKLALAFAALLATTGFATATPVLKGDITVNRAIVTIGDLFEDAGMLAETAIFLAPAPGTTGVVPLADVERAATMAGLTSFENVGYSRVRVARASSLVDGAALNRLIEADLRRQGIVSGAVSALTRFDVADIGINAEAVENPAELLTLRYTPGSGSFAARFSVAGHDKPVDVSGTIELMTSVPRLRSNLPAGSVLGESDFEMATVALTTADAGGYADLAQLVGQQLVRQARAGLMLRPSDVAPPSAIRRNTIVTALLRSGPMTLTVRGTALGTAAAGEPVDVLNPQTRKVLHGVARADGTVEIITAASLAAR